MDVGCHCSFSLTFVFLLFHLCFGGVVCLTGSVSRLLVRVRFLCSGPLGPLVWGDLGWWACFFGRGIVGMILGFLFGSCGL